MNFRVKFIFTEIKSVPFLIKSMLINISNILILYLSFFQLIQPKQFICFTGKLLLRMIKYLSELWF